MAWPPERTAERPPETLARPRRTPSDRRDRPPETARDPRRRLPSHSVPPAAPHRIHTHLPHGRTAAYRRSPPARPRISPVLARWRCSPHTAPATPWISHVVPSGGAGGGALLALSLSRATPAAHRRTRLAVALDELGPLFGEGRLLAGPGRASAGYDQVRPSPGADPEGKKPQPRGSTYHAITGSSDATATATRREERRGEERRGARRTESPCSMCVRSIQRQNEGPPN